MNGEEWEILPVTPADAEDLAAIYRPYVEETAVSFEYSAPDGREFARRIADVTARYPYLKAVAGGKTVGYAYAHRYRERAAYDRDVEASIYVDRAYRRGGVGRALYRALAKALKRQGIRNLYACVTSPREENDPYLTRDSHRFHIALGFHTIGTFPHSGYKFGRWYDTVWYALDLDEENL